jgi:hypothetical protein
MKPVTAINLDCIPEKEYLSPEFQLGPISESGGVFIYESSNPAVFTVDQDGVVTITGPGRAYVIIKQLESDSFAENQIDRLIVVNKSKPPITFLGPDILLLTETSLSTEILKIETVVELIRNVFSTNENVLEIIEILPNEYRLIPISLGKSSITVLTNSNYYFDSNVAHFDIEVLENLESLSDKPLLLNIKVFGENFKHNALKDVDILTSNKSLEVKDNNLQLSFQQETRGYNYDVPILNLAADKFVDNVATYNREILCCSPTGNLNFSVNWDFGNNLIFDYFPYEGNVNDLPRINLFRSDGKYIEYMSGGFNFLKIPPNSGPDSANAYTYQKWGNRNAGTRKFTVPEVECLNFDNILGLYYGVDFFTTEELRPIVLDPPSGQWKITNTAFGDLQYQYLFTGTNQKDIQIMLPPLVAPNTPEGLVASNVSLNSFTVSWNPSAKAINYRLDVSTLSDFSTFEQNFENLTVNGTSYSITGLTAGTTYYIRIRAVNTAGSSDSSSPLQQGTLGLNLSATNISDTSFTAVWNSLELLSPTNTVVYLLSVSTSSNFSTFVDGYDELAVLDTSQLISGLTAGIIYYVKVRATDQEGLDETSPTLIQITAPLAPEITTTTNITATSFNIFWSTRTGAQSYRLDIARDEEFTDFVVGYNNKFVSGTTDLVNGLVRNTVYFARVRATNNQTANPVTSINSTVYSQSSLVNGPSPITMKNFINNSVTLNWPEIPNASNYFIDVTTNNKGYLSSSAPTYILKSNEIVNGTEYIFTDPPLYNPGGLEPVGIRGSRISPVIYDVKIRADNSDYSRRLIYLAPLPPSGVKIQNASQNSVSYRIEMGGSADYVQDLGLSYLVEISNNSDFNTFTSMKIGNIRRDIFTDLAPSTEYYLRARARYFEANSLYSSVSQVLTAPAIPAAPSLSLIENSSGILVNWTPPFGATGYLVQWTLSFKDGNTPRWGPQDLSIADMLAAGKNRMAGRFASLDDYKTTGTNIVIEDLPQDKNIFVRVAAVNSSYSSKQYSVDSKIRSRLGPVRIKELRYLQPGDTFDRTTCWRIMGSAGYSEYCKSLPVIWIYHPELRLTFTVDNIAIPTESWRPIPEFTASGPFKELGIDWRATRYAYQISENVNFSDNPPIIMTSEGEARPLAFDKRTGDGGTVRIQALGDIISWDIGIFLPEDHRGKTLYLRFYGVSPEGLLGMYASASYTFPV